LVNGVSHQIKMYWANCPRKGRVAVEKEDEKGNTKNSLSGGKSALAWRGKWNRAWAVQFLEKRITEQAWVCRRDGQHGTKSPPGAQRIRSVRECDLVRAPFITVLTSEGGAWLSG